MSQSNEGFHHLHKRKRVHQKLQQFPHPEKWKRVVDDSVYIAGVIGPLLTLPQIIKIWVNKTVEGVSLITWSAFLAYSIVWLVYGITHKEKPLIIAYVLWVILQIMVVAGIIMFG
ncbi:hypothetical protein GOV08_02625 [Candidatus Woesearchaeota archaeon]|nr:hypothetical protein [Candidatus Woesearchaeota archaeon]